MKYLLLLLLSADVPVGSDEIWGKCVDKCQQAANVCYDKNSDSIRWLNHCTDLATKCIDACPHKECK